MPVRFKFGGRVDSYEFAVEDCVTGIPEFAGYELIGEVTPENTTFFDDNKGSFLDFGALYCYRLVAVFPEPAGGVSYASTEVCGIIQATAPVITNVTVDQTGDLDGEITIKWRSPFEIDQLLFPPPYLYDLYRVKGLNADEAKVGDTTLVQADIPDIDTVFVDTGIDTENDSYHYYLVLKDSNGFEVITSSSASSVELEPKPLFKEIEITWEADVPWSNNTQDFPMHYIFRDNVTSDDTQLVLIDSVDVNFDGFMYTDAGQFNDSEFK